MMKGKLFFIPRKLPTDNKTKDLQYKIIMIFYQQTIYYPVAQCVAQQAQICSNAYGGWFMPHPRHSVRLTYRPSAALLGSLRMSHNKFLCANKWILVDPGSLYWTKHSESTDLLHWGRSLPQYCPRSRSTRFVGSLAVCIKACGALVVKG